MGGEGWMAKTSIFRKGNRLHSEKIKHMGPVLRQKGEVWAKGRGLGKAGHRSYICRSVYSKGMGLLYLWFIRHLPCLGCDSQPLLPKHRRDPWRRSLTLKLISAQSLLSR